MSLSVIIPAYNEERGLPATLEALGVAVSNASGTATEVVVVDNASLDGTSTTAREHGARVVSEPVRSVARARNRGAAEATGTYLVFLDADVAPPPTLLETILTLFGDTSIAGGGCDLRHRPRKQLIRAYLSLWRVMGRAFHMVQGGVQFARRDAFDAVDGYDERIWMGEDVDFIWRLRKHARTCGERVVLLRDPPVTASSRRFDQWSLGRTLWYTNPLVTWFARRRPSVWKGWYEDPPR